MNFKPIYYPSYTIYSMFKNNNLVGKYFINNINYMYNFNIEESFRGKKYSHNLIKQCVEKHSTHFNYPLFLLETQLA